MAEKTAYESGARKLKPLTGPDPSDEFSLVAAENHPPAGGYGLTEKVEEAAPGTTDERPRWEGPAENRPRGYLPALDDPETNRDAAGENLRDPERRNLADAMTQRSTKMDHASHPRLRGDELIPSIIEGATIYGADDHKIGTVSHMHGTGAGSQVIIDIGGFLGIGAKPVAVSAQELDFMRDESGAVHAVTSWTKDQLKQMPEHHH